MKVLIVDDSETLRTQLRRDLETAAYVVVEAADGLEGLAQLKSAPDVELIICDLNMPKMDGLAMCAKVPEVRTPPPKIIIMTTETNPDIKKRGKELGVVGWVTKPYVAEKLLAAIKIFTK